MSEEPKVIELTLLDGTVDGAREVNIASSDDTYRLFVIPRDRLLHFRTHGDLNKPGVYMMLGALSSPKPPIYIGQADKRRNGNGTINRVLEHLSQGRHTFCEWAIMLVDDPTRFGPTELNNLENRFTLDAKAMDLVDIRNGNEPSAGQLSRVTELRLSRIVRSTRIMLASMGIYIFQTPPRGASSSMKATAPAPIEQQTDTQTSTTLTLYIHLRGKSEPAILEMLGPKRWVLKAGSTIRENTPVGRSIGLREQFASYIVDGQTTSDIEFTSSSTAAMFVNGFNTSGPAAWKTADGQCLKELIQSGQLAE